MLTGLIQHANKVKFLVAENSPTILTGVGVVGTVTTAYLTGRASFKAAQIIEKEKQEIEELQEVDRNVTTFYKVRLIWKLYIPPFGAALTTVASIIAANKISSARIAALGVAAGISEKALQEYKDKVLEKFGENKARDVRDEIAQDRVTNSQNRELVVSTTGDVLCYDLHTGRYFQNTMEGIKRAENKINYDLNNFMSASLSEFYDEIGLPPTSYSDTVGWNANNRMELTFSTVMSPDGRPCIAIDFVKPPFHDYQKVWDN